jgi:hypothetical protein
MPHRPPHESSDRELNGNVHQSMRIGQRQRDPLAPKKHHIVIETEPGKYSVIGESTEPLEMLRLQYQARHAISHQDVKMAIVDEDQVIEQHWSDYKPAAFQDPETPITPENQTVRDRWILNIIQWLLPASLSEKIGQPDAQEEIQNTLTVMNVEIAVSPTGCGVLLYRDGESFAAWKCDQ